MKITIEILIFAVCSSLYFSRDIIAKDFKIEKPQAQTGIVNQGDQ